MILMMDDDDDDDDCPNRPRYEQQCGRIDKQNEQRLKGFAGLVYTTQGVATAWSASAAEVQRGTWPGMTAVVRGWKRRVAGR